MTRIFTELITRHIDNERFVQLEDDFVFESDVLRKAGLQSLVTVPKGFVQDFESVPIVRGSNKRGGTAHDYFCRIDSVPVVTKAQAAEIYREIMAYTYHIDSLRGVGLWAKLQDTFDDFKNWSKRWSKWAVVYVYPGYFHKFRVMATCREIAGIDGDPYVTIQQLDELIEKTEQVSADLRDVDINTDAMVTKTDAVTEDLKDARDTQVNNI